MRRYLQQSGSQLVGWLLALLASAVYILTMEPSVSFWDCGEFITTSQGLEIGHPPGAPVYQLLAHIFTLFAGSNLARVAWWSNLLSAVAGGLTVSLLYGSILLLFQLFGKVSRPNGKQIFAAALGSLCYLFCDTAWFSVVESEVYSLAMFFGALLFWIMLRWYRVAGQQGASRWLLLMALVAGLSACVHEMCLLVLPAFALLFLCHKVCRWRTLRTNGSKWSMVVLADLRADHALRSLALALLFFCIGLSPYLILPIRAQANPPLNEGDPSTWTSFKSYMNRDQYAKAPLYPRIWRSRGNDHIYYADWSGNHAVRKGKEMKDCFADNLQFFVSYQLWYMYGRYLMWNFSGRYNDRQGYGSLQNGQFVTGFPPIDKLLVGTAARPPRSLHMAGHNVYFMLPLLLGLVGACWQYKRSRLAFWSVMLMFLFGGPILAVYLNMPAYEPRERDYAFVISFFAFTIWIAYGALAIFDVVSRRCGILPRWTSWILGLLMLGIPSLMAAQNWDDHDRSDRYFAHDYARNYLNACAPNAILFSYGDNDTFPLWYIQEVEHFRQDVQVVNLSLLGTRWYVRSIDQQLNRQGCDLIHAEPDEYLGSFKAMTQILTNNDWQRPVYLSHYAKAEYKAAFEGRMQVVGYVTRVCPDSCDTVAVDDFANAILEGRVTWAPTENTYIDGTTQRLLDYYWRQVLLLVDNMIDNGETGRAIRVLDRTLEGLPYSSIENPEVIHHIVLLYKRLDAEQADSGTAYLRSILEEQLCYYHTLSPKLQRFMVRTIEPRETLWDLYK